MIARALTIRQPWAWAILYAGKDIENRSWPPPHHVIGHRIAIHAGKHHDRQAIASYIEVYGDHLPDDLPRGAIIGSALVAGYVCDDGACSSPSLRRYRRSPWFQGPFGWVMTDPKPAPSITLCHGALSLWRLPDSIAL